MLNYRVGVKWFNDDVLLAVVIMKDNCRKRQRTITNSSNSDNSDKNNPSPHVSPGQSDAMLEARIEKSQKFFKDFGPKLIDKSEQIKRKRVDYLEELECRREAQMDPSFEQEKTMEEVLERESFVNCKLEQLMERLSIVDIEKGTLNSQISDARTVKELKIKRIFSHILLKEINEEREVLELKRGDVLTEVKRLAALRLATVSSQSP
ncbi:hypothetical protein GIB67_001159 [Kingdonia uniflora]|uniref:Uncharacterized protein n=1 Tax=Kingdonia uniflora TaxID=39325 RepID=A0A7J7LG36_9MAGN|nr:hypothetical protein GIB67_001159 [Kingdonia uniflora]